MQNPLGLERHGESRAQDEPTGPDQNRPDTC